MKKDETYLITKVKKTDRRVKEVHISEPVTPSLARRRTLQNKITKIIENRDKYLERGHKNIWKLIYQIKDVGRIDYSDLTKDELSMIQKGRDNRKVGSKEVNPK